MSSQLAWLSYYGLLLKWQALRMKPVLPLTLLVQLLIGVGTVIGMGYIVPQLDKATALYLTTGGPTLILIALGLVLVPQLVSQAKSQGTFEYIWSLPIPRMAFMAADLTVWLALTLPGLILAVIIGAHHYDFELQVIPLVIPAMLLVALTATNLGYAIAHLVPRAEIVTAITNFIVFCLFLFSPINFPVERLPDWLGQLHRVLPVMYAANVVRGTLSDAFPVDLTLSFIVLAGWCLLGFSVTAIAITRRN